MVVNFVSQNVSLKKIVLVECSYLRYRLKAENNQINNFDD